MKLSTERIYFEEFVLDPDQRRLRRADRDVPLRRKTFGVLCYLVEHRHRVVSKEELLDTVWTGVRIETQGVFQSISELRSLFGRRDFIRTVRGVGYQWVAPTSESCEVRLRTTLPKYSRRVLAYGAVIMLAAVLAVSIPGDTPFRSPSPERHASDDSQLQLARDRLNAGAFDSAEQYLRRVLDANPDHLEARLDLAYVHQERGLSDSARDLAEAVHSDAVETGTAYVRMASAAFISQLPKSATDRPGYYAQEAVSIGNRLQLPVFAAAGHERLGELYLDQGESALAASEWGKAIENYQGYCPDKVDRVRRMLASIARNGG